MIQCSKIMIGNCLIVFLKKKKIKNFYSTCYLFDLLSVFFFITNYDLSDDYLHLVHDVDVV